MDRNTRQKALILETVKNNRIHPTIYQIYDLVQKQDPSIGQATVYRNIKKFVEQGKIFVVKTKKGIDRYDYYNQHIHFECLSCSEITDIFDDNLFKELKNKYEDSGKIVINYNLSIDGYCEQCKNK